MKSFLPIIVSMMLSVVGLVLFTNVMLFANEQTTTNVTITATIRPSRIVIVDEGFTITKILSNTSEDVRPIVVQDTADGKEVEFSESIFTQYEMLKPSLNFSKPGVLYEREDRPVQAVIKRLFGRFTKTVGSPI